jgi:hypothetical protein
VEAVSTSETSITLYETIWCNIPEDSNLHSHSHDNLKSHRMALLTSLVVKGCRFDTIVTILKIKTHKQFYQYNQGLENYAK